MRKPAYISRPVRCDSTQRETSLIIEGARVATGSETAVKATVEIGDGHICAIASCGAVGQHQSAIRKVPRLDLSGWLLLPGLINAHDHLELNLFPRLGPGPFRNYREWAEAVYHPETPPVRDHLRVPKPMRLWWGVIKNMLCGVTTVCHHNPAIPTPLIDELPIRVLRSYGWAHSLVYGGDIPEAFQATPPDAPFIIHLAEGSDEMPRQEIYELNRLGALNSQTVIIHGVGLDDAGHERLEQVGAALVWCPTSNMFTLGRTLGRDDVLRHRRVALGSDSAMTGAGDLLDEIRYAYRESGMSAADIYRLVTTSAVDVLRLPAEIGRVETGSVADVIAIRDHGLSPSETLVGLTPDQVEFVMLEGRPVVMSSATADRWPGNNLDGFAPLRVGSVERLVRAPIASLIQQARECLGDSVALAGRPVSA